MSAFARRTGVMSVPDFFRWEPGDRLRYELVDGEPRAMAPASTVHACLQNELGRLIGNHLRERGTGCDVLANPGVVPRLLSGHNVRIPDLAVTCTPVTPGEATLSDPVSIVEILSPGNQAKAWSNVRAYSSLPSVQEILVLHTGRIAADLLRRAADATWPEEPVRTESGHLVLAGIGLRVPLAALNARTGLGARTLRPNAALPPRSAAAAVRCARP